jgi:hypothetical protein
MSCLETAVPFSLVHMYWKKLRSKLKLVYVFPMIHAIFMDMHGPRETNKFIQIRSRWGLHTISPRIHHYLKLTRAAAPLYIHVIII